MANMTLIEGYIPRGADINAGKKNKKNIPKKESTSTI